jgi:2-dehydropantoate 2-reductase
MRILVVGVGVIGSVYGWALAGAGHQVTHLVRPGRAASYPGGVPLDVLDHRRGRPRRFVGTYPARVTEAAAEVDLVIVPTKPYQLMDALGQTVPQTHGAPHLLLTQNWRGTAEVEAVLPSNRFVYGDAQAGGTFAEGRLVAAIFPPRIFLGRVDGGEGPVLDRAEQAFAAAGIRPQRPHRILEHIWVQYAINAGLWPAVVRAGGIRPLLRDRQTSRLSLLAVGECLDVVAARGVDLRRYGDARLFHPSTAVKRELANLFMQVLFRVSRSVERTSAHVLADHREVTDAYAALVGTGHDLGVPMPVMRGFAADIARFAASPQ